MVHNIAQQVTCHFHSVEATTGNICLPAQHLQLLHLNMLGVLADAAYQLLFHFCYAADKYHAHMSLPFCAGTIALEATISSLRSLLVDREHHLTSLEAELAVARSASGSSQGRISDSAQGESALRLELDVMRRRLSEKEAQIVSSEERLSRLEAVHRVAQVCCCDTKNQAHLQTKPCYVLQTAS